MVEQTGGGKAKGSEIRGGRFVLLEQCAKCGREVPAAEIRGGFCLQCEAEPLIGALPGWAVDIPVSPHPGRIVALIPRVMRFPDIFETWTPLKEQVGADALDRRLAPLQTAWGPVSRYCSMNLRGRELAIAVVPFAHILEVIGPHMRGDGVSWRISAENGVGPRMRVDFLFRGIVGFGALTYVDLASLENAL